jgi:hypothetical protein
VDRVAGGGGRQVPNPDGPILAARGEETGIFTQPQTPNVPCARDFCTQTTVSWHWN